MYQGLDDCSVIKDDALLHRFEQLSKRLRFWGARIAELPGKLAGPASVDICES